jgi:hypothetical protein
MGFLFTLVGLTLIMIGGLWKPATGLVWNQWKARIAPVHLAWMAGLAFCAFGLILVLRDTFLSNNDGRDHIQAKLRAEITELLQARNLSQRQLNALIAERYSKSGLLSLNENELKEVRALVERNLNDRSSL